MLNAEKARQLADALNAIDVAKEGLTVTCKNGGSDEEVAKAGQDYLDARTQMGEAMAAIAEQGEGEAPPAEQAP